MKLKKEDLTTDQDNNDEEDHPKELKETNDEVRGGEVAKKRKRKRKPKNKKEDNNDDDSRPSTTTTVGEDETNTVAEQERTLYVEGLPFDATADDVWHFFHSYKESLVDIRLPKWHDTGRLRGYGHLIFVNRTSLQKCLEELNGKTFIKQNGSSSSGRYITLSYARGSTSSNSQSNKQPPRDQPQGCATIFIKNLPYDITEEEVYDKLNVCGKILDLPRGVRLARDSISKQAKGFGYVEFKTSDSAYVAVHKAAKANGIIIKGRRIIIDYEEGQAKGSFKTRDGKNWHKETKKKQEPRSISNTKAKRPKL